MDRRPLSNRAFNSTMATEDNAPMPLQFQQKELHVKPEQTADSKAQALLAAEEKRERKRLKRLQQPHR